jgi:hypothetical protein
MRKRRRWRTLIVAVALVAGATGVAYATAAVTSTTTKIQACQNNTNGLLRVVSDASTCRTDETAVSWNVQGPQGEQGPQGRRGQLDRRVSRVRKGLWVRRDLRVRMGQADMRCRIGPSFNCR